MRAVSGNIFIYVHLPPPLPFQAEEIIFRCQKLYVTGKTMLQAASISYLFLLTLITPAKRVENKLHLCFGVFPALEKRKEAILDQDKPF